MSVQSRADRLIRLMMKTQEPSTHVCQTVRSSKREDETHLFFQKKEKKNYCFNANNDLINMWHKQSVSCSATVSVAIKCNLQPRVDPQTI